MSQRRHSSRRTFLLVAGAGGGAAAAAGVRLWMRHRGRRGEGKTVVILPFETGTSNPGMEWMGKALSELLTANLSRVPWLRTVSSYRMHELTARNAPSSDAPETASPRNLAVEAHADYFITGTLTVREGVTGAEIALRETESRDAHVFAASTRETPGLIHLADQCTVLLTGYLGTDLSAPTPAASRALTGSPEALQAWVEAQVLMQKSELGGAVEACRRAIAADPGMLLAHIGLASLLQYTDPTEAIRISRRAEELARRAETPGHHRALAGISRLYLERRLPECASALEAAAAEYPQETGLLTELAGVRLALWELEPARMVLETALTLDYKSAVANSLSTTVYAFQADVSHAISAADRYAGLLPKDDPEALACRANALAIDGRMGEALSLYRKAGQHEAVARAAIHTGQFDVAEAALARVAQDSPAQARAGEGALHLAMGNVEKAVAAYAQAADLTTHPVWCWYQMLKAATLLWEQGRPGEALSMGHRLKSPLAAGVRATSHAVLGAREEAVRQYEVLYESAHSVAGSYVADAMRKHHQMLSAFYRGDSKETLDAARGGHPAWRPVRSLCVARALLATNAFRQAEQELRFMARTILGFGVNPELAAMHDYGAWMLTRFYLGQALEKLSRGEDAATFYSSYLQHAGDGRAALPQTEAARARLKELRARVRRQIEEPRK